MGLLGELKQYQKLFVYECDNCNLYGVTIHDVYEFPPAGWLEEVKYLDHHGKTELTGKTYCPHCRKDFEDDYS